MKTLTPITRIFIDEISSLLLEVPNLMNSFESKSLNAISHFKEWLQRAEEVLQRHRKQEVSILSGLRGRVLSMERGVLDNRYNFTTKKITRRQIASSVGHLLNEAQQELHHLIAPGVERLNEANVTVRQVLAIAWQKGIFVQPPFNAMGSDTSTPYIPQAKEVWHALETIQEVRGGLAQLLAVLGSSEAQVFCLDAFLEWHGKIYEESAES